VVGYGLSSDAKHITEPDPTGPVNAFQMALATRTSRRRRSTTSMRTRPRRRSGDSSETQMLKYALGEETAYNVPVSGTKGATGHCLGAAGAIEGDVHDSRDPRRQAPPTINYEVADPACDLDYVPNEPRDADVEGRRLEQLRLRRAQRLRRVPRFED
jgi:3-oxoacyl-[acyl-carrier-protein] synthase II